MKQKRNAMLIMALCHTLMATTIHDVWDCPTVSTLSHHQVLGSDIEIRWDSMQKAQQINVTEPNVRLKDAHNKTSSWILLASFPIQKSSIFLTLDDIKDQAQHEYTWLRAQPKITVEAYGGYMQCAYLIDGHKRFIIAEPL